LGEIANFLFLRVTQSSNAVTLQAYFTMSLFMPMLIEFNLSFKRLAVCIQLQNTILIGAGQCLHWGLDRDRRNALKS